MALGGELLQNANKLFTGVLATMETFTVQVKNMRFTWTIKTFMRCGGHTPRWGLWHGLLILRGTLNKRWERAIYEEKGMTGGKMGK